MEKVYESVAFAAAVVIALALFLFARRAALRLARRGGFWLTVAAVMAFLCGGAAAQQDGQRPPAGQEGDARTSDERLKAAARNLLGDNAAAREEAAVAVMAAGSKALAVLRKAAEPDEKTRKRVATLVDELGSDDYKERERATAALKAEDYPALVVLRAVMKKGGPENPEVRKRLLEVTGTLEKRYEIVESVMAVLRSLDSAEKVLAEAAKKKEWRRLRRIWRILSRGDLPGGDDVEWMKRLASDAPESKGEQTEKDGLLDADGLLAEVALVLRDWHGHVSAVKRRMMCYKPAPPPARRRNRMHRLQMELLKKLNEQGKLPEDACEKVEKALSEADRYGIRGGRHLLDNLNGANTALVFRALRSLSRPPADWAALPRNVKERVGRLVEQLKSEDYKEREAATKALLGLGPAVAPALKEALERSTDEEQKKRLRWLLDNM